MYDSATILASVDANRVLFIALGGLAMVFNYTFFFEAIRAGRRDKVFAFPLAVSTVWFAHDLSFVLRMQEWFGQVSHWYVELFWVALIPTTLFEVAFIWQVWAYGQDEIMPRASRAQFGWFIGGSVVAGLVIWFAVKDVLADPLYVFTFGGVAALAPVFGARRTIARGDAKGQSPLLWGAFAAMLACWYTAVYIFFGPAFQTPQQLALPILSIGGGIAMAAWCLRLQAKPAGLPRAA
jgi:hypothetical protein